MNNFQLTHEMHGPIAVVRVTGSLDMETFPHLENFFALQFEQPHCSVMLDCKELKYVASLALGRLVNFTKQLRGHGGELKLVNVPRWFSKIIDLFGLSKVLPMYIKEEEALASFAQPS